MRFDLDDILIDILLFMLVAGFSLLSLASITIPVSTNNSDSSGGGHAGQSW